jgi:hypothetical protein
MKNINFQEKNKKYSSKKEMTADKIHTFLTKNKKERPEPSKAQ